MPLLNEKNISTIKDFFNDLEDKVTLVTILDNRNEKTIELKKFLEEISSLSDKVILKIYEKDENKNIESIVNATKLPIVSLFNNDFEYSGVKYHGIPKNYELTSFLSSILNLSRSKKNISEEVVNKVKKITKNTNIKVGVTLSCHNCPKVVEEAQKIALLNPNIEAEMIDLNIFKDIRSKYNIMSVPVIIINNSDVYFGAKTASEIVDLIKV